MSGRWERVSAFEQLTAAMRPAEFDEGSWFLLAENLFVGENNELFAGHKPDGKRPALLVERVSGANAYVYPRSTKKREGTLKHTSHAHEGWHCKISKPGWVVPTRHSMPMEALNTSSFSCIEPEGTGLTARLAQGEHL